MSKLFIAIMHIINQHPEFSKKQIVNSIFLADLINYNITGKLMFSSEINQTDNFINVKNQLINEVKNEKY